MKVSYTDVPANQVLGPAPRTARINFIFGRGNA